MKVLCFWPPSMDMRKILEEVAEVIILSENEKPIDKIKEADALLPDQTPITSEVINASGKLKIITVFGVGYDHIDIKAATESGVIIVNIPEIFSEDVAEFTILLMLTLARQLLVADRAVRENQWEEWTSMAQPGTRVCQKILGIIGLGNIGSSVAQKAKAFNMKILAFDPYVKEVRAKKVGAKLTDLETLLRKSDIVTIHTPLTQSTKGMIGKRELGLMKRSAHLINTSRGPIVDEEALVEALSKKRIAGAALDVFATEPIDSNCPLITLDNVVLSPHIAAFTAEGVSRVGQAVAESIVNVLNGKLPEPPANIVNPEVLQSINLRVSLLG